MSLAVSGQGWPAGAAVVLDVDTQASDGTLVILTTIATHTTAGPDGTFQTSPFAMPEQQSCVADASSSDVLVVARTGDGTVSADAPFSYTAQPTLVTTSSQQVKPGFAVSLTGENWEPGESVTITSGVLSTANLDCMQQTPPACPQGATPAPSATAHTTASPYGDISLTYALPDGLPPRTGVLVQATGTGPLYGTFAAPPIEFLIRPAADPTIALDRLQGVAGVAVHVSGAHWYPGDTVVIEYCRGQNTSFAPNEPRCFPETTQTLGQATVDAQGRFSRTVSLPTNSRIGPILIQARVPNDVLGLAVYAQAAPFQIVPPPLPWDRQHPRLALALAVARPALPALALGALLLVAYVWSRRRARRMTAAHAK